MSSNDLKTVIAISCSIDSVACTIWKSHEGLKIKRFTIYLTVFTVLFCSLFVLFAKTTPTIGELILGIEYLLSQSIILMPLLIPLSRRYLKLDMRKEAAISSHHIEKGPNIRLWCIVIIPALLVSIFPKLFLTPGGDDVAYIKAIIETQQHGLSFLIWGDNTVIMRPLLYVYLTLLSYLFNNIYIIVLVLSKMISSIILIFGVYRLLSYFQISMAIWK